MSKTKILATIGPASIDKIDALIEKGLDGFRFNFSHITKDQYPTIAEIMKKIRKHPGIFTVADLEGPKLRLGNFEAADINKGDKITLIPNTEYKKLKIKKVRPLILPVQSNKLYKHLKKSDCLLIDDGKASFMVESIKGQHIICRVEYGEKVESRKGVNVPYVKIPFTYPTKKDKDHIPFILKTDFDYISASFVTSRKDIINLRKYLDSGSKIISKIENDEAIKKIDEIIGESDGIMIARGDLGMEIGVIDVPAIQKTIIEKCNLAGKPVITATQMLESMMIAKEPKRSEVSDIFNAMLDGTDVVMLSGETSVGKYPVETVNMMNQIVKKAEIFMHDEKNEKNLCHKIYNMIKPTINPTDLISKAVYSAAKAKEIRTIITPTRSGYTTRMIARLRLDKEIIAVTHDKKVRNQLNALWGVIPLHSKQVGEDVTVKKALKLALKEGYIKKGEYVIVTEGVGKNSIGSTNDMRILEVK